MLKMETNVIAATILRIFYLVLRLNATNDAMVTQLNSVAAVGV